MNIQRSLWLVATLVLGFGTAALADDSAKAAARRKEIDAAAQTTLDKLGKDEPEAKELLGKSVGYAVFTVTKGGFIVSGGGGNGVVVDKATASSVSFQTYVRDSTCGGATMLPSTSPSIKCEVTYTCSGTSCTRLEAAPGVYTGTVTTIFTGLSNSSSVFTYSPSTNPTYVGVTLTIPNPSGSGGLTASDGVSLRNATLND